VLRLIECKDRASQVDLTGLQGDVNRYFGNGAALHLCALCFLDPSAASSAIAVLAGTLTSTMASAGGVASVEGAVRR
jgi:hypothetical protein